MMLNRTIIIVILSICCPIFAEEDKTLDKAFAIREEGIYLYQLEKASWLGTDIMLDRYKDKNNLGGYVSYLDNETPVNVFFSRNGKRRVIGQITFKGSFDPKKASIDLKERSLTLLEEDLFEMREKTMDVINARDGFFSFYYNTSFNIIPLIYEGVRKVYVLTGPKEGGIVIFGNDYLLIFNEKNEIVSKRKIHNNMITIDLKHPENRKDVHGTAHSHLPSTGELITATDICTLLLYGRYAEWKTHFVMSDTFVSVWDCRENNLLAVIVKDKWEEKYRGLLKMLEDQKGDKSETGTDSNKKN